MNRTYVKLKIRIPQEEQDLAADDLLAFGFDGFEQKEEELEAWIPEAKFTESVNLKLASWLDEQSDGRWQIVDEQIVTERNWNEEWEKTIRPLTVGRFFIHPTWTDEVSPPDCIPLVIDPKMAFGTGYHETTRLLLRLLPDHVRPGDRVLDMGTGTGILAIAALRLGAGGALGIDIDPWCYDNALENARLNAVSDRLEIRIGSTEQIPPDARYDLILANINRNILLDMAGSLAGYLAPGGILMLSGILEEDVDAISSHPACTAMERLAQSAENEWRALVYRSSS
ncbi:MAG: 50S ribosomal protein L11 methyltransferase [Balneolaceae bacterium]|nr:MAG: 50S ribosomal protein L11 methyltransferase [Balneolaceae bacterium]